ncbi:MAG: epoxyqueuosine reductase QueH [Lachnospiraceae bacterium]|nr:epoxyqueuosine reductase QueH [Lachnospiraceae bacterium]
MAVNHRNYQKEMEKIIDGLSGERKSLLLHSCCAPCSSAVLEKLQEIFRITVFFYNPNISESEEYRKRVEEQKRLIFEFNQKNHDYPIQILEGNYEPQEFYDIAKGLEQCPEGGERCFRCYALRLEKTAEVAKEGKYDYFTTTLTISPLKNAAKLNEIGEEMAEKYGTTFLPSDFKKKEGYKRSIELSKEYDLYRQNFCGCAFSKAESLKREKV